ncbi:MAG: LysR family transcriptional regulator, positive regulator for ilvC [Verrucomicrobiota bacterium]|jgi:DNA-binding transcriptional LysR family regulator
MMLRVNIHHLELFYHVATHGGISAASRRMPYGIQQPAISGQISQLEKNLGLKLFHRRPFGLTPAGVKLFGEIELFFAGLKQLPEQVRGHAHQHLRLAAPAIMLRDYLPQILARYKKQYPNFRLTLHDANQAAAEELLRKREIDLAISELEGRPTLSIQSCDLLRLPLVLVVPKRLAARSFKDLFRSGAPVDRLISLPSHEVLTKHFQAGLRKLGSTWMAAIEVSSMDLIDVYTSLGFGVGISVAVPNRKLRSGLRHIALPMFPRLSIAALWIGELTKPAASFLNDVKKTATRLAT